MPKTHTHHHQIEAWHPDDGRPLDILFSTEEDDLWITAVYETNDTNTNQLDSLPAYVLKLLTDQCRAYWHDMW